MINNLFCACQYADNDGLMFNINLIELIHHNTYMITFVCLSSTLPCLKSNELSYMVKIRKVKTHS
jgi:hypothetical protein